VGKSEKFASNKNHEKSNIITGGKSFQGVSVQQILAKGIGIGTCHSQEEECQRKNQPSAKTGGREKKKAKTDGWKKASGLKATGPAERIKKKGPLLT